MFMKSSEMLLQKVFGECEIFVILNLALKDMQPGFLAQMPEKVLKSKCFLSLATSRTLQ